MFEYYTVQWQTGRPSCKLAFQLKKYCGLKFIADISYFLRQKIIFLFLVFIFIIIISWNVFIIIYLSFYPCLVCMCISVILILLSLSMRVYNGFN